MMEQPGGMTQRGLPVGVGNVFLGERRTLAAEHSGLKFEVNKSLLNIVLVTPI